ncbi:MAG: hypothetical protein ACOYYS_27325 [Chloroflexota bacterium]
MSSLDFAKLYAQFNAPIVAFDCGKKCSPYNEYGVPFCCDTHHAVPTAYFAEWDYLEASSNMWHIWEVEDRAETERLRAEAPEGQLLIECQGHLRCQRSYRSIICRAFPFFPYMTRQRDFIGLSYYWEYEDRCWVINHLEKVTPAYIAEFVAAFETIFAHYPADREIFHYHSGIMRRLFGHRKRRLPLLHRDGYTAEVNTRTGEVTRVNAAAWPKVGPYALADELPFPGEVES